MFGKDQRPREERRGRVSIYTDESVDNVKSMRD